MPDLTRVPGFDPSRLKMQRKSAGMTQAALAEAIGVDRTYVAQWESGRRSPRPQTLARIAHLLSVHPSDFVDPSVDPMSTPLATLRAVSGLTQQNMVDAAKMTLSTYSAIERGQRGLTPATAERIAAALQVDIDVVLDAHRKSVEHHQAGQ